MNEENKRLVTAFAIPVLVASLAVALGSTFTWALQAPPPAWYTPFLEHLADWCVAAFTGLLGYVTYRLVVSTNKLWEAGERQYKLSEETARRQLRAYVTHRGAMLEDFAPNKQPVATVPLTNSGQTPAHDLRVTLTIDVKTVGDNQFPLIIPEMSSSGTIGSQQTAKPSVPLFAILSEYEHAAIVGGFHVIFVWGHVRYRDIFGELHQTNIRLQYQPRDGGLLLCAEGNTAT